MVCVEQQTSKSELGGFKTVVDRERIEVVYLVYVMMSAL